MVMLRFFVIRRLGSAGKGPENTMRRAGARSEKGFPGRASASGDADCLIAVVPIMKTKSLRPHHPTFFAGLKRRRKKIAASTQ